MVVKTTNDIDKITFLGINCFNKCRFLLSSGHTWFIRQVTSNIKGRAPLAAENSEDKA